MDIKYDKEPILLFLRALTDRLAGKAQSGGDANASLALDRTWAHKRERSYSEPTPQEQHAQPLSRSTDEPTTTTSEQTSSLQLASSQLGTITQEQPPAESSHLDTSSLPPQPSPSLLFDEEEEEEEPLMVTVPLQRDSRAITPADRIAATLRNPFTCELLSKSSAKGFYESRYADVSLATMGCVPMFPDGVPSNRGLKAKIGQQCVYLRLGTSLVITGVIIETMEGMCQVSPDRGQSVAIEWVNAIRLFLVPENLVQVRSETRELIVRLLSDASTELR